MYWISRKDLEAATGLSKSAVTKRLKNLEEAIGTIPVKKIGRETYYQLEAILPAFNDYADVLKSVAISDEEFEAKRHEKTAIKEKEEDHEEIEESEEEERWIEREGIPKRVYLRPSVLLYYEWSKRHGYNGSLSDFVNEAIEDLFEKVLRIKIGVIREVKRSGSDREARPVGGDRQPR